MRARMLRRGEEEMRAHLEEQVALLDCYVAESKAYYEDALRKQRTARLWIRRFIFATVMSAIAGTLYWIAGEAEWQAVAHGAGWMKWLASCLFVAGGLVTGLSTGSVLAWVLWGIRRSRARSGGDG